MITFVINLTLTFVILSFMSICVLMFPCFYQLEAYPFMSHYGVELKINGRKNKKYNFDS